jgi:uncharacterized protein YhaN
MCGSAAPPTTHRAWSKEVEELKQAAAQAAQEQAALVATWEAKAAASEEEAGELQSALEAATRELADARDQLELMAGRCDELEAAHKLAQVREARRLTRGLGVHCAVLPAGPGGMTNTGLKMQQLLYCCIC